MGLKCSPLCPTVCRSNSYLPRRSSSSSASAGHEPGMQRRRARVDIKIMHAAACLSLGLELLHRMCTC
eukprot:scaffold209883_cov18-Tisochrysis_lutea.AAC.1